MIATTVEGCVRCGCPCALVGDEIPEDGLCPWCRAAKAPHVYRMAVGDRAFLQTVGVARPELPTLELDELELPRSTWVSPEVAAVCAGSLTDTLHRPSSPERSERDYDG